MTASLRLADLGKPSGGIQGSLVGQESVAALQKPRKNRYEECIGVDPSVSYAKIETLLCIEQESTKDIRGICYASNGNTLKHTNNTASPKITPQAHAGNLSGNEDTWNIWDGIGAKVK